MEELLRIGGLIFVVLVIFGIGRQLHRGDSAYSNVSELEKTVGYQQRQIDKLQRQIDELKRELEDIKRKE